MLKYIEENEDVIREYEVIIDEDSLKRIITLLDNDCSINEVKYINVTGHNPEEAMLKINSISSDNIKVINQKKLSEVNKNTPKSRSEQFIYECQYSVKKQCNLSLILKKLLAFYLDEKTLEVNSQYLLSLMNYAKSDDLIPFKDRMARDNITEDMYIKYENNKEYDFEELKDLYQMALDCFSKKLVAETVVTHYKDGEKVYKLVAKNMN